MKRVLIIIGASGHGRVIADMAIKVNNWREVKFLDDNPSIEAMKTLDIIGKTTDAYQYKEEAEFFVAIGDNETRRRLQERLIEEGLTIATLIHPNAVIGSDVEIGIGTAVMAGVVINSSTHIGKGCIINTSSSIDHDNVIEEYVHISPGVHLAGTVKIGEGSWLGIGSTVINNISICSGCIVGAGGLVIKSIKERGTYVGVPVRRVDK